MYYHNALIQLIQYIATNGVHGEKGTTLSRKLNPAMPINTLFTNIPSTE